MFERGTPSLSCSIDIDGAICVFPGATSRCACQVQIVHQRRVAPVDHLMVHDWVQCVEDEFESLMKEARLGVTVDMIVHILWMQHVF